jgi:phage terminase small subunit
MMAESNKPLPNLRWEKFAQLYAGEHFGNATQAFLRSGYAPKSTDVARREASRLLSYDVVFARIRYLRDKSISEMDIDRKRILEMRLDIAKGDDTGKADKLKALGDIERSLGLEAAQKIDANVSGDINVNSTVQFVR